MTLTSAKQLNLGVLEIDLVDIVFVLLFYLGLFIGTFSYLHTPSVNITLQPLYWHK